MDRTEEVPSNLLAPGTADAVKTALLPHPYFDDPAGWALDKLGVHLWSVQRNITQSVVENRYTAVQSCHGIGKSFVVAVIVAWWLDTRPIGQAFAVTTAPTGPQVYAILWRYIRKLHSKGKLKGRVNLSAEWYMGNDQLVAYGRKPADYDQTAFQGVHDRYVLVAIDEGGGVVKPMYDAASSLVTNEDCRVVVVGNPDDSTSYFFNVTQPDSVYNAIKVSAFDTPLFTGEEVPADLSRELVSPMWVEERKREWGEGSAMYRSKVLGEFTEDAEDAVIKFSWLSECQHEVEHDPGVKEMGLDVGAGGDESVLVFRNGNRARVVFRDQEPDTMRTSRKVAKEAKRLKVTAIKVDSIGIGKGVADRLKELLPGVKIVPTNVGSKSSDPDRFPKLRDELWWVIGRGLSEDHGWDLSQMPEDAIGQLRAPKWAPDARGRVKIESKADTKKRTGGKSPDIADALLLAYFNGNTKREWTAV